MVRYAIEASDALHLAAMRVQGAPEGTRNDILNKEAHGLRKLVAAGRLDRTHVENVLQDAALAAGLDIDEAGATIKSGGLNAGIRSQNAIITQKTSLVREVPQGPRRCSMAQHTSPTRSRRRQA